MNFFLALFLGIVQGVAEFLPISSSGHLSIFQNLFGLSAPGSAYLLFDVMLHIGTLVSICVVYSKDIRAMVTDTLAFLNRRDEREARPTPNTRTIFLILIATLPLLIAVPFTSKISLLFRKTGFVGVMLIMTGVILYVSDRFLTDGSKKARTLSVTDALLIGAAQMLALLPGFSRSGATICVARAVGADRSFAVKFSLLLSIPAVLGSAVITFFDAVAAGVDWSALPLYLVGAAVAGVVGIFAINLLRSFAAKDKFRYLAYYCGGLGALTCLLSLMI
ncbi:MAG: undecaprenyl-diphosphate phosphatase [Oscillospiraceae bacterium]|jgi:undecaprenyl-diphosphatase|nr:undecaprenyl-diphosphate phosphatase [Oscillospiraceae bacterium]